ncbi:NACHT-ANK domain protein transcript variant 1 [Tuber magnatum]|uniref:NACHT-ANK domain protein transcript variant 1 n=1 Tax=Tuber magnatum TaxID=42249 RepID=A0A317SKM4_9PEZI|nr:NACHT-ANK domain protein transcript variant 1 [Tuber magnatum]
MSNQDLSLPSEGTCPPQHCASPSIQGDYSGNTGHGNRFNSDDFINYHIVSSAGNRDEILQCLYTSAYEAHRRRVREPVEGTCAWVTEHPKYKEWLGKKMSGPLWLSADPGCGKSVIASFLVTQLEKQSGSIVCYFFFKDDNEEQRNAASALCAILHQLFQQRESLSKYATAAFKAKGKRFTEELRGGCGDVICVMDALDECEETTLARLIHHMTRLSGSQTSDTPLRFLVTSRPYYRIERDLGSSEGTIRLKGEEEVHAITADVARVIHEGIKSLELCWGQPGGLGYLRDLLESSADRTFLWVSLVLGILRDSVDDSREELTNIVSTAPGSLAGLYTKMLSGSRDTDRARQILHIVVAAARPLTLREMNVALKIRRDHKKTKDIGDHPVEFERMVKNLCGLFVRVIDSKIYLVHQTAKEFLIKQSSLGQGNWQYTLCSKESNFTLANICISYLSLEDFEKNPLAMNTPYRGRDAKHAAYVRKHTLLDYAASHWADHFRDSGTRQMELFELSQIICKGGSGRFLTWLRVYWGTNRRYRPFPNGFTHLMIATWLGQRTVVERLLEDGGDKNIQCKQYGTALNVAALRRDEDITRMLLENNVQAYLRGKYYNIKQVE